MKRTWIILALLASVGSLMAQQQDTTHVERQINIEKEYTPEIKDTKRKDIEYKVEETAVQPSDLRYSNYSLPIVPKTPFSPVEAERQNAVKLKAAKSGYAEIGAGFNMNWRAEGYYKILNTEENLLDVYLNHWGICYGGKQNPKTYLNSKIAFDYKHFIYSGHELHANVGYRNLYYSFYGIDSTQWDSLKTYDMLQYQCRHTLNLDFNAHSTKSMNGWDYKAEIGYRMDDLQYSDLAELYMYGGATGLKAFGKHQIELRLRAEGYIYSNVGNRLANCNNALVELSPYYNLNLKWMDLHMGARLLFSCVRGSVFNAMPDVTATFHLHKMVRITAAALGDYHTNSVASLMDGNPYYIFQDTLYNTYTPADFRLGITITPASGLMLNLRAAYAFVNNDVNYMNIVSDDGKFNSRYFEAEFINTQHLSASASASYTLKDRYLFHADFTWNRWYANEYAEHLSYKPECELHAGVELMPIDGLRFDVNYYLATGRKYYDVLKGESVKMTNIHDLNIGASYLIKKLVSVYVHANNILGSVENLRWQRWNGYDNLGFNMTFGAKISF